MPWSWFLILVSNKKQKQKQKQQDSRKMTYFRTRAGNIQESKDVLKTKQKCLIDKGLSKGHNS